ncbi:MAG: beta-galactosidase trimerization domain-containing protein, partial [Methanosarcinales archaeon]|nr:beta-galactosidase trimerization domain-containing protein [Methanosarcinales archaeon]
FMYHNLPGICVKPPYNQIKMEEIVDVVGFDLYYYKEEYHKVKRCVQYLNSTSRAPFIPEFASGFVALPIPVKPIMLDDAEFTTYAALMHGFSGINFYMLVERERWVGSPIDRFGGVREERFRFYQRFNRIVERINYQELRIKCEGILLINRDCARLELASSLLTPIPIIGGITPEYYVSEDDLGFNDVIQLEYGRQWDALYYGFGAAKYAVTIGDTELPLERLSEYRVVAVPTFDFMSRNVQDKLINYVKGGGCLVIGPRVPGFDEHIKESGIIGEYLPKPDGRMDEVMVEGIKLKDADIFDTGATDGTTDGATGGTDDAISVLTADPGTITYQQKIGSGSIIHFGFLFPKVTEEVPAGLISIIDRIAAAGGMRRVIPCTDPQIDAAVHIADGVNGADGREILFVANTGMGDKDVDIGGIYLDPDSEEMVGPMIRIPAYTVRILEVASHDR